MEDNSLNLIETFAEFKEFKNIDRETLMRILEDVFRSALTKKYGPDANFDIIVNVDRGDLEIQRYREIVEDGEVRADEYADFAEIKSTLDKIALSVSNLQLWVDEQIAAGNLIKPGKA